MKYNPIPFLLEAPQPWITYNVFKNLIPDHANAKLLSKAKIAMMDAPLLQESIKIALIWEKYSLKRQNDAIHPIHRLELLVELRVDQKDLGIPEICEKLLAHQSSKVDRESVTFGDEYAIRCRP